MVVSYADPCGSSPIAHSSYRHFLPQPLSKIGKVLIDLIGALSLILVMLPLLLAIAAMVKLDGGPVLGRASESYGVLS